MTSTVSLSSAPSVARGVQTPRIQHVPDYVSSAGQEAIELAAVAGLVLDPWEAAVLTDALGERDDGKWSAFEVGLVVPRQNGKGSVLEARELAGLILFGERLLIHSAHEQATATEHFLRLLALVEEADLSSRLDRPIRGKGSEAILFRNGARILFKTRTGGGGRGLTGDFVCLDEAMILPEATTAALVPTMAARSVHGNPQLWYTGSAVDRRNNDHGVVLARVRERGIKGAERLAYFEWSAPGEDPDAVPAEVREDPRTWATANPGMGIRISSEHIANECAGALGPREFAVERLGIGDWPPTTAHGGQIIDVDTWNELTDPQSTLVDPVCFALDVTPDRSRATISVAGRRDDDLAHVEVVDHRRGTGWVAERAAELVDTHDALPLRLDASGPAASLLPDLERLGVEVEVVSASEHAKACGLLVDRVEDQALRHLGTQELRAAIQGAARRPLGDAWAWSRKKASVDISPLVSCTLALWGFNCHQSHLLVEVFS